MGHLGKQNFIFAQTSQAGRNRMYSRGPSGMAASSALSCTSMRARMESCGQRWRGIIGTLGGGAAVRVGGGSAVRAGDFVRRRGGIDVTRARRRRACLSRAQTRLLSIFYLTTLYLSD